MQVFFKKNKKCKKWKVNISIYIFDMGILKKTGGVIMKKYFLAVLIATLFVFTGCSMKNNSVTDNNDNSDLNPNDKVAYNTTVCTKMEQKDGVTDNTSYEIHYDGNNVKSITMKMNYQLNDNELGMDVFNNNKSIFNDMKDMFKDAASITTNVVEDSASLFKANLDVAVDNMSDDEITRFDRFTISKDLEEQKRYFENEGYTCK